MLFFAFILLLFYHFFFRLLSISVSHPFKEKRGTYEKSIEETKSYEEEKNQSIWYPLLCSTSHFFYYRLFCVFKKRSISHLCFDSDFCFFYIIAFQKRTTQRSKRIERCTSILFSLSLFFFLRGGLSSRILFCNQFHAYLWTERQIEWLSG